MACRPAAAAPDLERPTFWYRCWRTHDVARYRIFNSITLVGSELVRSWFEPDRVMEFGFEPVCDQLRTSFEPATA